MKSRFSNHYRPACLTSTHSGDAAVGDLSRPDQRRFAEAWRTIFKGAQKGIPAPSRWGGVRQMPQMPQMTQVLQTRQIPHSGRRPNKPTLVPVSKPQTSFEHGPLDPGSLSQVSFAESFRSRILSGASGNGDARVAAFEKLGFVLKPGQDTLEMALKEGLISAKKVNFAHNLKNDSYAGGIFVKCPNGRIQCVHVSFKKGPNGALTVISASPAKRFVQS